jgi:hypothetical protein
MTKKNTSLKKCVWQNIGTKALYSSLSIPTKIALAILNDLRTHLKLANKPGPTSKYPEQNIWGKIRR